jgi:hypothetical protein
MIVYSKKIVNARSRILASSKIQSIINGGKISKYVVGYKTRYYLEIYWKGLQKIRKI